MKIFRIEGLVDGQWDTSAVGHPTDNTFETEAEAEACIPELARIFKSPEAEFRVVAEDV